MMKILILITLSLVPYLLHAQKSKRVSMSFNTKEVQHTDRGGVETTSLAIVLEADTVGKIFYVSEGAIKTAYKITHLHWGKRYVIDDIESREDEFSLTSYLGNKTFILRHLQGININTVTFWEIPMGSDIIFYK